MARFLNGQKVRAIWCELLTEKGDWTPTRLFLSTDIDLTPEQVFESYGLRWSNESMFYQLKQLWGMKEAWQQRRQTLSRWVHLTSIGYGLIQLLTLALGRQEKQQLCIEGPWRRKDPITAGRIRQGLEKQFRQVNVRLWWNRTCKKLGLSGIPNGRKIPRIWMISLEPTANGRLGSAYRSTDNLLKHSGDATTL